MIDCISPSEFAYFISLLSDISVSVLGDHANTIIVHAEAGDILWERHEQAFCMRLPLES